MPKPLILQIDTKDDRREVLHLLERIAPADRLAWLGWCCRRVRGPHAGKVRVSPRSTGRPVEVAMDFYNLANSYDLDPLPALARLAAVARRRGITRRLWRASGG